LIESTENKKELYSKEEVDALFWTTFAKLSKKPLIDLQSNNRSSLSFKKFSKDNIIEYLKNPQKNIKNIRNASIYMFNNSTHYRRLISQYALMPEWAYVLLPYKFDMSKTNKDAFLKQYTKYAQYLEKMNIKDEFATVSEVSYREDVFFGVIWENNDSFFIQKIDPDICELSSIEDGVYNYAIDMSKIKESELFLYPLEFTQMYNTYKANSKEKMQEVPTSISVCFKVNRSVTYPLPLFAGTMVSLHDIEDYKMLVKARTEIQNYKLIGMEISTKDGVPTMEWKDVMKYYNLTADALPEGIGLALSPFKFNSVNFERSGGLTDSDEVYKAEEDFWRSSGTSSALFGGGNKNSISSLKFSIKSDEMIVISFMNQVERWINRKLKELSGNVKFKICILPITKYNKDDYIKSLKEAATLGIPVKSEYCAAMGIQPIDIISKCTMENDFLGLSNKFIPLSSSYTQSNKVGKPESDETDLQESGIQTKETDQNEKR